MDVLKNQKKKEVKPAPQGGKMLLYVKKLTGLTLNVYAEPSNTI